MPIVYIGHCLNFLYDSNNSKERNLASNRGKKQEIKQKDMNYEACMSKVPVARYSGAAYP